jgi:hypothetical protein
MFWNDSVSKIFREFQSPAVENVLLTVISREPRNFRATKPTLFDIGPQPYLQSL